MSLWRHTLFLQRLTHPSGFGTNAVHLHPTCAITACLTFPDTVFAGSTHFPPSAQLLSISGALRAPGEPGARGEEGCDCLSLTTEPATSGNRGSKQPSPLLGSWMASEDRLLPSPGGWLWQATITLCLGAGLGTPPNPPGSGSSDNTPTAGRR